MYSYCLHCYPFCGMLVYLVKDSPTEDSILHNGSNILLETLTITRMMIDMYVPTFTSAARKIKEIIS